jgi:GNAT superfamily N-acetyltransferase
LNHNSTVKEEVITKEQIITIQDFLRTNAKYQYLNLENGITFPNKSRSKAQKVTPTIQTAKPEEAQIISEIFKQVYQNTYPYKEMENPQEIRKMIEDPDYTWMVFKINEDEIIGCVAVKFEISIKSVYLHGFAMKKEYQGTTSLPKLVVAAWTVLLKKYEKKALIWFGEARSAHSKSQFLSDLLGLKPIAFLPKKDIFFGREESELLLILYDEDLITKYRRKLTPKIIPRVLKYYTYALKRYQIGFPEVSDHATIHFDNKKTNAIKQKLIYQEENDNMGNSLITFSIKNSNAYLSFLYRPSVRIFEKTEYNVLNKEQLFVFIEEGKELIRKLKIRYWEFFASAYNPIHQVILYNSGLKPFGYVPCHKYIKEEDIFEDQIAFIYYDGKFKGNLKLIPETENFLKTIEPSWDRLNLSVDIFENPNDILKYLQLGISLPVRKDFYEFLIHDFKVYRVKSLILKEDNKIIGHTLVYDDGGEVLFFGFFGVKTHEKKHIGFLLRELIKFAQKSQFKIIRGPINPPTFIYGWGFMTEDSSEDLCISKPVNPPIYQEIFAEHGFYIKSKQGTWEGEITKVPEEELLNYDFEGYEIYSPKDWNDIPKLKLPLLMLSARNLAKESQVTPSPENLFENFFSFVKKYGGIYMVKLLKHKQSGKFVGCFISLPDPLKTNQKGKFNSFVGYSLTIDKEHRGKGLSLYLIKEVLDAAYDDDIRYASVPMEINVFECRNLVKNNFGFSYTRTHIILERKV